MCYSLSRNIIFYKSINLQKIIMYSKIYSATTLGINSYLVDVEVDISMGLVNFFIVGLPDTAIKESAKRISSALKNCGIRIPDRKVTVNLAPANLKKEGTLFDLPIAVGIMLSAKIIDIDKNFIDETIFLGELSLDGSLNGISGALAIAADAKKLGKKRVILPLSNYNEACMIPGIEIIGIKNLIELTNYLNNRPLYCKSDLKIENNIASDTTEDFSDVKGQEQAKRALLISAAGKHNILFIGSPGSGKTMLAKRLPTIMPDLSFDELVESSKVYSVSGKLKDKTLLKKRPFRSPHHTISQAGLIGGGSYPQPGEVSLSHNGILFLDELTEFKRTALEVLRQPLESKSVTISRANQVVDFPANFLLVAATNPCPCGYYMDKKKACQCSQLQVNKYLEKLSGPLLDRVDIQVPIATIEYETIKDKSESKTSSFDLKQLVDKAARAQFKRFGTSKYNSEMNSSDIEKYCTLEVDAEVILKKAFDVLGLSMRGYHKILKLARTIADLDSRDDISAHDIKEAINYRSLDKVLKK